jgi:hypothetical protein
MFFTGLFKLEEDVINTAQKAHGSENYDDNGPDEFSKKVFGSFDGYVTNVGNVLTIHIKSELNTESNIKSIKKVFGLFKEEGVDEVVVAEISEE